MTTPNFDFLDKPLPQRQAPTIQSGGANGGPDFSFLDSPQPQPQEAPMIERGLNTVGHIYNLWQYFGNMIGTSTIDPNTQAEIGSKLAESADTADPTLHKSIDDIRHIFAKFGENPSQAIDATIQQAKQIKVADVLKGIPEGFASILTAPIKSVSGLGLDRPEFYVLTPEERAQEIKNTAGNFVGLAVGFGAGKAVGAGLGAITDSAVAEAATQTGTKALAGAVRDLPTGALARKIVKGTLEAGAFGASQSAVAYANDPQQLTQMIMNGVLFAPLGGVMETLFGHDPAKSSIQTAKDILKTRQFEMTENLSLKDVAGFVDAFATAKDVDDAIINKHVNFDRNEISKLSGVEASRADALASSLAADPDHPLTAIRYYVDKNTRKILLLGKDRVGQIDIPFYQRTGFVRDEVVGVRGKDYILKDVKDGTAIVTNMDGSETAPIPINKIREKANGLLSAQVEPNKISTAKINRGTLEDRLYSEWKGELVTNAQQEYAKVPKDARDIIGIDDKPPENIAQIVPDKPFEDSVMDFIKRKGLPIEQAPSIMRMFEGQLHADLMDSLEPQERMVVSKLARQSENFLERDAQIRMDERQFGIESVMKSAESNGFYMDHHENAYVIRDRETDKILSKVSTLKEAQDFIDASGQKQGIELDGGGSNGVPPRMFGTLQPNPEGPLRPNEIPFIASPDGWMGNITSAFNTIGDWLTPNREILIGLDNKFGTKFFERVYDPTQVARAKANAAIMPWYNRLKMIEAIDKRMGKHARELVGKWLETMSVDEIVQRGGGGGRKLNQAEIDFANALVNTKGDITKAFKFNRQVELEIKAQKLATDDVAGISNVKDKIRGLLNITPEDLKAAQILQSMRGSSAASIGPVTRLARAIQDGGGMTRDEFAKANKMKSKHIQMGQQLEQLFKELAPIFGIDPQNLLQNYMTHARLYAKGDITGTLNFFDMKSANKEFYANMTRTGEIDAYETDPIRAAQRYIKAGFDAQLMQETLDNARKAVGEELLKIPDDAQGKANHVVQRYLTDLQGSPGPASKFTQNVVDKMLRGLGIEMSVDVRKNIVNTISATGEAAAQGFRLVAGIRDFYTGLSLYYARFGVTRTVRMLKFGVTGLEGLSRQSMSEAGVIPVLSQVAFDTPTEFTSTVLGRSSGMIGNTIRKVGEVGLKLSGQKDVYALMHAGSYLDTWSLAGENLRKMNRGEITKAQAYKNLAIESYHVPVANEFDRLVSSGKFDEAAQMLARATGAEQVGIFGLGNNPGGWNRNIGRIAGQFGSWSMWYRAHMMQMASRGSYGYRAAALTRLAATQAALVAVGAATGVRLGTWSAPAGILFGGGPLVDAFETVNDAIGGYGPEQQLAQSRLKRFLPFDGERFNFGQIYIPGGFFARDLARAYDSAQKGASPPQSIAEAIGFRFR